MTYADFFNLRGNSVKFNDIANAIDSLLTRSFVTTTMGSNVAYTVTPNPPWENYTESPIVTIIPHVDNAVGSPSVTLNVSGLGAIPIKKKGADLVAADLRADSPVILIYNGSAFEFAFYDEILKENGSNYMLANLNANNFRITNIAKGTQATDAVTVANIQDSSAKLATAVPENAYSCNINTPVEFNYVVGGVGNGTEFTTLVPAGFGALAEQSGFGVTICELDLNSEGYGFYIDNGTYVEPLSYKGAFVEGSYIDLTILFRTNTADFPRASMTSQSSGWMSYPITSSNFRGTSPNVISSITSVEVSRYIVINQIVTWQIGVVFNLGTGGGRFLQIDGPVACAGQPTGLMLGSLAQDSASAQIPGISGPTYAGNIFSISRDILTNQNWAASSTCYFRAVIRYPAAERAML